MSTPDPTNPGALNWFLVNLLGIVWGTAFLSIGIALETLPPFTLAASRVLIAALALVTILPIFGVSLRQIGRGRALFFAVIAGVVGFALPFVALAWGQQFVPSAVAGVAMGTVPLLLVPLVFLFSPEEGIGPRRIIGLVLGFLGILLILGPGLSIEDGASWTLGVLGCMTAAIVYAVASIVTRRSPAVHPILFAAVSMLSASVILVPLSLLIDGMPTATSTRSLLAALYLGLFPTAMAAALRVRIIKTAGSLFMSIAGYLVPLWAVVFGITLMGETLSAQVFLALALILGGIAIAQSRQIQAAFGRSKC